MEEKKEHSSFLMLSLDFSKAKYSWVISFCHSPRITSLSLSLLFFHSSLAHVHYLLVCTLPFSDFFCALLFNLVGQVRLVMRQPFTSHLSITSSAAAAAEGLPADETRVGMEKKMEGKRRRRGFGNCGLSMWVGKGTL